MPVDKQLGDKVFGGTVNGTGSLTVRADGIGKDTVLSGIIRLVEEAQSSKAPIQKLADKVSAIFVPAVIGAALLTFVLTLVFMQGAEAMTEAISRAVAVLVIACPCSLGLATPTALMVGTGRAATMGVLIKSADALETACRIDRVLLDKTGTVTMAPGGYGFPPGGHAAGGSAASGRGGGAAVGASGGTCGYRKL